MNGLSQMALKFTVWLFRASSIICYRQGYYSATVLILRHFCARLMALCLVLVALKGCSADNDPSDINNNSVGSHQEGALILSQIASEDKTTINRVAVSKAPSDFGASEAVSDAGGIMHPSGPAADQNVSALSVAGNGEAASETLSSQAAMQGVMHGVIQSVMQGESLGAQDDGKAVSSALEPDEASVIDEVLVADVGGYEALLSRVPLAPGQSEHLQAAPLTFRMFDLETQVVDESFTPHFKAVGKVQVAESERESFGPNDVVHLWLSYQLEVASVSVIHKGTLTLSLQVKEGGAWPEGQFELSVPLPRHDLSADKAELRFDVLGWQPLQQGRLEMQATPIEPSSLN